MIYKHGQIKRVYYLEGMLIREV